MVLLNYNIGIGLINEISKKEAPGNYQVHEKRIYNKRDQNDPEEKYRLYQSAHYSHDSLASSLKEHISTSLHITVMIL